MINNYIYLLVRSASHLLEVDYQLFDERFTEVLIEKGYVIDQISIRLKDQLVSQLKWKLFHLLLYLHLLTVFRLIVHIIEVFRDLLFQLSIDLLLIHEVIDTILLFPKNE